MHVHEYSKEVPMGKYLSNWVIERLNNTGMREEELTVNRALRRLECCEKR